MVAIFNNSNTDVLSTTCPPSLKVAAGVGKLVGPASVADVIATGDTLSVVVVAVPANKPFKAAPAVIAVMPF